MNRSEPLFAALDEAAPTLRPGFRDRGADCQAEAQWHLVFTTARILRNLWGRLATCGGVVTRPNHCKRASRRRLPTGEQDNILPHN